MMNPAIMLLMIQAATTPVNDTAPKPTTKQTIQAQVQANFQRLDANKDGYVDKAEAEKGFDAARAAQLARVAKARADAFAKLDTNKDGSISKQEFDAASQPPQPAPGAKTAWLEVNDIDKNGRVALNEAVAKAMSGFDLMDTDKDGTLTAEELRAVRPRTARK